MMKDELKVMLGQIDVTIERHGRALAAESCHSRPAPAGGIHLKRKRACANDRLASSPQARDGHDLCIQAIVHS